MTTTKKAGASIDRSRSVEALLESTAADYARRHRGVTKEQAYVAVLEANPEVYAAYREQHNAAPLMAQLKAAGIKVQQ